MVEMVELVESVKLVELVESVELGNWGFVKSNLCCCVVHSKNPPSPESFRDSGGCRIFGMLDFFAED